MGCLSPTRPDQRCSPQARHRPCPGSDPPPSGCGMTLPPPEPLGQGRLKPLPSGSGKPDPEEFPRDTGHRLPGPPPPPGTAVRCTCLRPLHSPHGASPASQSSYSKVLGVIVHPHRPVTEVGRATLPVRAQRAVGRNTARGRSRCWGAGSLVVSALGGWVVGRSRRWGAVLWGSRVPLFCAPQLSLPGLTSFSSVFFGFRCRLLQHFGHLVKELSLLLCLPRSQ